MKLHYQALTFHLMSHVTAATSTPATSKVILLINPRHMQGECKVAFTGCCSDQAELIKNPNESVKT